MLLAVLDSSANDNSVISIASANGHTYKVLLADPRVDPSAKDNAAYRFANGRKDVVKVLLADSRLVLT